jgi:hypothetical protein
MLRIVSHLEYLLKNYDCVIVPQLGGFVLQAEAASYVAATHLFRPMQKDVVFNTSLKYDDGLLAEQYMNCYGVSFQQARRMMEEDVEEIKALLFKELKVLLGNVGTLYRGTEGQITFQSGDTEVFSVDSYGLTTFQVRPWEELQHENKTFVAAKKNIYYLPINRKILRGVAIAAAAIALFLMISTPVKDINPTLYTASFVPTEIVRTRAHADTTLLAAHTPATKKSAVATRKAGQSIANTPMYYVIISSVKTKKQADEIISKVERAGITNVNKLVMPDKIRIYANKFTDKNKAETYLTKIRKNPKYQDAWIYVRNK